MIWLLGALGRFVFGLVLLVGIAVALVVAFVPAGTARTLGVVAVAFVVAKLWAGACAA